jgi:hypothetical protein
VDERGSSTSAGTSATLNATPDVPRLTGEQLAAMELIEEIANDLTFPVEMDFHRSRLHRRRRDPSRGHPKRNAAGETAKSLGA